MQIEEEKTKEAPFSPSWKIFFWEAFLFSLTLGLGIISSLRMIQLEQAGVITPAPPVSLWQFILSFSLVLLIVFLVIKFVKFRQGKRVLFKFLFIFVMGLGGLIFLEIWFGTLLALIFISILIIFWFKQRSILLHNLLLILGISGAGTFLGLSLKPIVVVFLLIIFSIYDVIAVYKTKHMIKMAKEMIAAGAIPGIILPPKISELQASLKDVKVGGRFLILGGGDIVFPLLLVTSLVPYRILDSLIVAIFATLGLLVSFWIFVSQKTRKPIPALPPIALFSILGYLITKLI